MPLITEYDMQSRTRINLIESAILAAVEKWASEATAIELLVAMQNMQGKFMAHLLNEERTESPAPAPARK